jgi:hypothetical protein
MQCKVGDVVVWYNLVCSVVVLCFVVLLIDADAYAYAADVHAGQGKKVKGSLGSLN